MTLDFMQNMGSFNWIDSPPIFELTYFMMLEATERFSPLSKLFLWITYE